MATFPHQRFERMCDMTGKCWLWKGSKKGFTVGSRKDGTRMKLAAQVFSYRWYEGPVPPGMVVFRVCKTEGCVFHGHLRVGTRSEMIRHAVKKKRWTQGNVANFKSIRGRGNRKLSDHQAIEIFLAKGTTKALLLARRYQVCEATICGIWNQKTHKEATHGHHSQSSNG